MNSQKSFKALNIQRLYVYLWYDVMRPNESKFGQHMVNAGEDPWESCLKRVRNSADVQRHRVDGDEYILLTIWNVTELATKQNKFYEQSKIDDWLRDQIGHKLAGEWHTLSAEKMKVKVDKLLYKLEQPLPEVELSTYQGKVAVEALTAFANGAKIILAELCARFGKTIWAAVLGVESDAEIIIVASYMKSVFTSFQNDISGFQQFADCVLVDTSDKDYEEQINNALGMGKKVFACLSLCNGDKRQERINFLFDNDNQKLLLIDEADYGAKRKNQALPLIEKQGELVKTVLMSGTGGDKAVAHWKIDKAIGVTYAELLFQKKETELQTANGETKNA
jgi:hypothetical protein